MRRKLPRWLVNWPHPSTSQTYRITSTLQPWSTWSSSPMWANTVTYQIISSFLLLQPIPSCILALQSFQNAQFPYFKMSHDFLLPTEWSLCLPLPSLSLAASLCPSHLGCSRCTARTSFSGAYHFVLLLPENLSAWIFLSSFSAFRPHHQFNILPERLAQASFLL